MEPPYMMKRQRLTGVITAQLQIEQINQLRRIAAADDRSVSAVIRMAIAQFLSQYEAKRKTA